MGPTMVWLDLEMTGLNVETCAIIELGIIITGPDLVPKEELNRVIWQPPEVLERMEPRVRQLHTVNGLLERVKVSTVSLMDAQRDAVELVSRHARYREAVLCGNSIHVDRAFLSRHMPHLQDFLHYRQVDVSSLKVLMKAWYPQTPEFEKPGKDHTTISDLRQSLGELAHYKKVFFRDTPAR